MQSHCQLTDAHFYRIKQIPEAPYIGKIQMGLLKIQYLNITVPKSLMEQYTMTLLTSTSAHQTIHFTTTPLLKLKLLLNLQLRCFINQDRRLQ